MTRRRIAYPGYVVGSLLVLFPLLDTLAAAWPLRPELVAWRFAAAGVLSRALLSPLLGVLVIYVAAAVVEQRAVFRALAAACALAALALAAVVIAFVLDALQLRGGVPLQARAAFDVASGVAVLKYLAGGAALAVVALAGWRAGRAADPGERGGRAGKASGIVVRPRAEPEA